MESGTRFKHVAHGGAMVCIALALGCAPALILGSSHTQKKGEVGATISAGASVLHEGQPERVEGLGWTRAEGAVRYGLTDRFDVGVRVGSLLGVEGRYQLVRPPPTVPFGVEALVALTAGVLADPQSCEPDETCVAGPSAKGTGALAVVVGLRLGASPHMLLVAPRLLLVRSDVPRFLLGGNVGLKLALTEDWALVPELFAGRRIVDPLGRVYLQGGVGIVFRH